ncbi:unnamed protein product [Hymenolepis diminuta]|uniref:Uncharacterized protein n=1 Tax=Hymenolepis diminuta TaxID=6216 RepID=A0A564Y2Q1_HYMDI|nr:unnamed protein product [Hymenolepis diminuta]
MQKLCVHFMSMVWLHQPSMCFSCYIFFKYDIEKALRSNFNLEGRRRINSTSIRNQ